MTRTIDLASKNALTGSLLASQARQPIVERPPISINRIWICRCTHLCFRKTDGLHSEGLHISDHPILSEATPYLCVRKSGGYCLGTYISRAADFACGSPLISVIMKKSGAFFLGAYLLEQAILHVASHSPIRKIHYIGPFNVALRLGNY